MAKTAFVFPGQGAQTLGMGRAFAEAFSSSRERFEEAEEYSRLSLRKLCWEGPQEELQKTKNCQIALYTTSMALMAAAEVTAQGTSGLSLGEYSAACAAGVFSFADGVRLVCARGSLMHSACEREKGAMAAVLGMDEETLQAALKGTGVVMANFNSPGQIVISGPKDAVFVQGELLKQRGAKRVIFLDVHGAFHSPLMKSACIALEEVLGTVDIKTPHCHFVMNVCAKAVSDPQEIRRALAAQVCAPVRWQGCIEALLADGFDRFIEFGPPQVLAMGKKIAKDATWINISEPKDLELFA